MQGRSRAIARLLVMGLVMGMVLVGAVYAGLATTTAIAIGIGGAGVVGLLGVARRPSGMQLSAADQIAAMMAPPAPTAVPQPRPSLATEVEVMAPQSGAPVNPEANMPRWRRPSLLEARHSDYSRSAPAERSPMRFSDGGDAALDVRVVRYVVVPVLDRPDEVLGLQLSDLGSGDEVEVIRSQGAFLEVVCPNGDRGWVHRTTLGQRGGFNIPGATRLVMQKDADDALTALLSARGLI